MIGHSRRWSCEPSRAAMCTEAARQTSPLRNSEFLLQGQLLARVSCAVINGELAQKLKVYEEASVEEISPGVQFLLDQLNQAAA